MSKGSKSGKSPSEEKPKAALPRRTRSKADPVQSLSADVLADRKRDLAQLFPEVLGEQGVDFDRLRLALGDSVDGALERYTFSWAGKRDAIRLLQARTRATLMPNPAEGLNFENTKNLFIEGENLEVLKILYKAYFARVKMIYIDPPYNTGGDFVYRDSYTDPLDTYLSLTGQKDENGNITSTNPETNGRYHSAWLSMMYPRLFIARQVLAEDGVIFVSIDDHELQNLRMLMNEVFGEESFIGMFVWQSKKGGGSDNAGVVQDQEYVLAYAKANGLTTLSRVLVQAEELDKRDDKGPYRRGRELNKWGSNSRREDRPTMWFPIPGPDDSDVFPIRNDGAEGCWRWGKPKMLAIVARGDVEYERRPDGSHIVYEKIRSTDPRFKPFRTWLTDVGTTADGSKELKDLFDGRKVYDYPKPVALIKHLIGMGTLGDGDIVLDFFAGSCTTGQAVLEANREDGGDRSVICVQFPEPTPAKSEARKAGFSDIAGIGKDRIRRVIKRMEDQAASKLNVEERDVPEDLGFRTFTLTESNFKNWKSPEAKGTGSSDRQMEMLAEAYARQMELFVDSLSEGWKADNVIWEVAVKEGFSLISRVEKIPAAGTRDIYRVSDDSKSQSFVIDLDDKVETALVTDLRLSKDDLFVCRDSALDDTAAANLALLCRLKTI